ncbi:MAG: molybdenum cofactor guanylyltransferase [Actinomycetota bacterium]
MEGLPHRPRSSLPHTSDVTGIVLAGGRSSRFGRDKLKEPYRGRPLLHHPVEVLAELCTEILVVVSPESGPPDLPGEIITPVRVIEDAEPYAGPLAGLAAGLNEADTALGLVVGGDMPGLVPAVLVELILVVSEEGVVASALAVDEGVRPLPFALRVQALSAVQWLLSEGERSLKSFLGALDARAIPEETWRRLDPTGGTLRDVDRPEDLQA